VETAHEYKWRGGGVGCLGVTTGHTVTAEFKVQATCLLTWIREECDHNSELRRYKRSLSDLKRTFAPAVPLSDRRKSLPSLRCNFDNLPAVLL
jgi:hypothetical protein